MSSGLGLVFYYIKHYAFYVDVCLGLRKKKCHKNRYKWQNGDNNASKAVSLI